jgi:hypothetical protein
MPAIPPNPIRPALDQTPLELSTEQQFEIARHSRLLDEIQDVPTLQNMCKLLLENWLAQKAATAWVMRNGGLQR